MRRWTAVFPAFMMVTACARDRYTKVPTSPGDVFQLTADVELAPGHTAYVTKSGRASTADVLNALSPLLALANLFAIFAIAGAIGSR